MQRSEGAGAAEAGASAAGGEEDDGGAGDKAGASGLSFEAKMRAKMEERRKALGKVRWDRVGVAWKLMGWVGSCVGTWGSAARA